MVEEGINSIPIILPGIAKILAISNTSEIPQISSLEILLIRVLSQIVATHKLITNKESPELAKAIGADPNGLVFSGEFLEEYKKNIKDIKNGAKNELLILNVKRLIEYVALFSTQQIQLEEALWQYKIGQEIIAPARADEFKKVKKTLEDYLQKDLSKFLIERKILSFGRKSGRSQIDLYHKDIGGEEFIIETKIYDDKNKLNQQKLKKNIVQLQSYMTQINQPRGILAIYNFSNTVILPLKKWLQGRMLIICINLCELPPSKRSSSLEIIESESDIISLIKL